MPDYYTILPLIAAALAMQITPGPDMMLVMGRGIGQGYRVAQATALGIASAGLVQLPLLSLGISSLVTSEPWLFNVLRIVGAAYLIYVGLKFLRTKPVTGAVRPVDRATFGRAVFDGALANFLNPKMIVFQLAFLPQFVSLDAGPIWSQILILGLIMKCCGFVVMSAVALTSGVTGRWMARNPFWLFVQERFVGVLLIGLGARLLLDSGFENRNSV
jgi:threonine/homoserine/homoserine lactone efflux protein